jgi:heptosyltransferase-2
MNIRFLRAIDKYFLWIFCVLFGILAKLKNKKYKEPKKILLIKLWAIGDSVLTLALLNGLRKEFPDAEIDVIAKKRNADVYTGNKFIDNVMLLNIWNLLKCFRKYDLCFDCEPYLNFSALLSVWSGRYRIGFSNQMRSVVYDRSVKFSNEQHMVQNYLDMIRVLGKDYDTDKLVALAYSEEDKEFVDNILKNNRITKSDFVAGVSPGVAESVKSRMWPRFAWLADEIAGKYKAKIILIDSPSNIDICRQLESRMKKKPVNLAGKFNLKQIFYLMTQLSIFIGNDTGPMHIAAAQGTKTIGLFGPNIPVLWRPYTKKGIALYHKVYCSPCIINEKGIMPECIHKGTHKYQMCMKKISVKEVMEAVERLRS